MIGGFTFALGCISSSHELHNEMFLRLMKSPMEFFDMTPVGRILNRFSKDIDTVDNVLPINLRSFLTTGFMVNGKKKYCVYLYAFNCIYSGPNF